MCTRVLLLAVAACLPSPARLLEVAVDSAELTAPLVPLLLDLLGVVHTQALLAGLVDRAPSFAGAPTSQSAVMLGG
jgi:hypothetical protein